MKKTIILCAAALEIVALSGCGTRQPSTPAAQKTPTIEERRAIAKKIRENSQKANRPVKYAQPSQAPKGSNAKASAFRGVMERRRHGPFDKDASARFAPAKTDVKKKAGTTK